MLAIRLHSLTASRAMNIFLLAFKINTQISKDFPQVKGKIISRRKIGAKNQNKDLLFNDLLYSY